MQLSWACPRLPVPSASSAVLIRLRVQLLHAEPCRADHLSITQQLVRRKTTEVHPEIRRTSCRDQSRNGKQLRNNRGLGKKRTAGFSVRH